MGSFDSAPYTLNVIGGSGELLDLPKIASLLEKRVITVKQKSHLAIAQIVRNYSQRLTNFQAK